MAAIRGALPLATVSLLVLLLATGCGGSGDGGGPSLSEQYRQALQTADPAARVTRLLTVADKQHQAGDPRGMEQSLYAASNAADEIQDPIRRASALNRVATELAQRDRLGDARKLLKEVRRTAEQIEQPALRVPELARMGYIHARYLDNRNAAIACLDECEELADQVDPERPEDAVAAKLLLAYTYHGLQMSDQADALLERTLAEAARLEDPRKRTDTTADAAAYLHKMKRDAQGDAAFQQAETFAEAIQEPLTRAHALVHLSQQLRTAGKGEAADRVLDQAETLADQVDNSLRGTLLNKIREAR
jgi:hypothetical protein